MTKRLNRTYRSESLSLSPLNLTLTRARKNLPPRISRMDVNEQLASKLIERMKLQIKKYGPNGTAA